MCFVGAGSVNFGCSEGPWDHARRLESLGGVVFVAIVDPFTDKARDVLERKRAGPHASMYAQCEIFADLATALQQCHFDVAFIGELLRYETTSKYKSRSVQNFSSPKFFACKIFSPKFLRSLIFRCFRRATKI